MKTDQMPVSGHVEGIEQLDKAGCYRLANKYTVVLLIVQGIWTLLVHDNDLKFCGVANKFVQNGISGNWAWVTATGDGTDSQHTLGPRIELRMVDGHLLPPIDKAQWSYATGMSSMMVTDRERAAIMAFRGKGSMG